MENPNRNFKSQTCEDFIEVLASKAAVPGGGGASALAGAIGIALGNLCRCRRRDHRMQKTGR